MKWNVITIIILLVLNVYSVSKHLSFKRDTSEMLGLFHKKAERIREHQDLQIRLSYRYLGEELQDVIVMDTLGKESSINDILSEMNLKKIIICRLSDHFCTSCNEDALVTFRKVMESYEGKDVMYICSCEKRFRKKYIKNNGLMGCNVYFADDESFFFCR